MSDIKVHHKFHLVNPSVWPLLSSLSALVIIVGSLMYMHEYKHGAVVLIAGFMMILCCMYSWWKDTINEGRIDKAHTHIVKNGLSIGMLLFIVSEVMFFVAFFWSFFAASLDPAPILDGDVWPIRDGSWPPEGIKTLDPWNIPFLNTLILLLSGTTVTWAHHSIVEKDQKSLVKALGITVLLGASFTCLQIYEYYHAEFRWKDGIYSSNFYMTTGFHGFHVLVGTLFLFVCYLRAAKGQFANNHGYLGLDFAAWYWHFVDVVWLFLFVFLYIWGS